MKTKIVLSLYYLTLGFIVVLFSYTALMKFLEHDNFVFQMQLAPVPLMKTVAPILGRIVPAIEALIVGAMLISSRMRLLALWATLALISIFTIYISAMLLSGLDLPCTCGGIISTLSWKQHLLLNIGTILLTAFSIYQHKNIYQIESDQNHKKSTVSTI